MEYLFVAELGSTEISLYATSVLVVPLAYFAGSALARNHIQAQAAPSSAAMKGFVCFLGGLSFSIALALLAYARAVVTSLPWAIMATIGIFLVILGLGRVK